LFEVAEGAEERVLDNLLGILSFPHYAKGECHGAVLVPIDKSPEPANVTTADRFDYFSVRIRHSARLVFPLYTVRLQSHAWGFSPATAFPARPPDHAHQELRTSE
jgi:hypothetical protein